ncbi:MAG: DnaJ domain-containing protein [Burkholderiales bacterium]|nr:DnaJ domain-containing protein [Burkholderiales bacterium]
METTLYQTLGIKETAPPAEIKAALRALVRDYHRGNLQGDAEETLRFINQACSILTSADKRAEYDSRLAEFNLRVRAANTTVGLNSETPSPQVSPATIAPSQADLAPVASSSGKEFGSNTQRDLAKLKDADRPRSTSSAEPGSDGPLTISPPRTALSGTLGLRRMGPVVAKFQRVAKPVSGERPWRRLTARLIDYGLWGLAADALIRVAAGQGLIAPDLHLFLTKPLIAAMAIPASWMLIEILLLNGFRTTPGKWLTNVQLRFSASDPSLREGPGARPWEVVKRCFRVWVRGAACGIPLLNLIAMDKARRHLLRMKETSWDFDGDCLVTHRELGFDYGPAAGAVALLLFWLYGTAWVNPLLNTTQDLQRAVHEVSGVARASIVEPLLERFSDRPAPRPAPVSIAAAPRIDTAAASVQTEKFTREARRLDDKRDWKEMVKHCRAWSLAEPKHSQGWHCLGIGYDHLADYPRAVDALKQAAKLAPGDLTIKNNLLDSFRAQYQRSTDALSSAKTAGQ